MILCSCSRCGSGGTESNNHFNWRRDLGTGGGHGWIGCNSCGGRNRRSGRQRRAARERDLRIGRVGDIELSLTLAVDAERLLVGGCREPIRERSEAGANGGLAALERGPGRADTRREVVLVAEQILRFVAHAVAEHQAPRDTVVVVDGEILGQPRDDDDARRMLRILSGKWHEVLTGVALMKTETCVVEHETTRVRFSEMSAAEIDWYVGGGEPRGKAGAYGIQGSAALFIKEIEGDYFNVVGLPVRLVFELSRRI